MSLRVRHLNADTSWLLTFSPPCAGENPSGTFPSTFTILLDPWLSGPSKIWSSKFSLSHHKVPACIDSLAELPDPDVVIISQDKADHCNEGTLRQLSPSSQAIIIGPSAATKKIRSWNHFNPDNIRTLKRYDTTRDASIFRIEIPPFSPLGSPGEVTISLIAGQYDLTGLHNAIGITYRPPSSVLSAANSSYAWTLPTNDHISQQTPSVNVSSPRTPPMNASSPRTAPTNASHISLPSSPPITPPETWSTMSKRTSGSSRSTISSTTPRPSSITLMPSSKPIHRERALSVIYSPHGLSYNCIRPFATSHLSKEAALPLTALFHCFNRVTNPWYLGGNVSAGFLNGLEIAEALFARTMISCHDEDKECVGFSTKNLKTEKYSLEDARKDMGLPVVGSNNAISICNTQLVDIGVGQDYFMSAMKNT